MKVFYNGDSQRIDIIDERFYESKKTPGVFFPGVTTVLEAYMKGYGFTQWLKDVGHSAEEILRRTGEVGSHVHEMIDFYLKGFEVSWLDANDKNLYTLEEWQLFSKAVEFFEKFKPEILTGEFNFCNESRRYGGTIDLICKINNEIWLIDHKTSNAIYKTHELQVAAYVTAWNDLNPQYPIKRTGILWLKAATRGEDKQGKKIQGEGWQLKEFDRPYQDAFRLFEHTQAIWEEENPNWKPKNLTYPVTYKMGNETSL